ncbi:MAG TPA: alanine racemase [Candidatus Dormibacteraeota bacterium]
MRIGELVTPALVVDAAGLDHNLRTMQGALGERLRPHVKAHKCTALARRQAELGATKFTCATIREVEGLAAAGIGDDLLLANEVVDATRLARLDARVTVAVDSEETIRAAAAGPVREVLVDVDVGVPRCGCPPEDAGRLAELARGAGLEVRGVMGYEGHAMIVADREARAQVVEYSMEQLLQAHQDAGGEVISAGGTGTYDMNPWANEIQAGSYALMDSAYAALGLPLEQALSVLATVISVSPKGHAVANCGLKSLGMDHGNPSMADGHEVFLVSDEHVTFFPGAKVRVGDRVLVKPAHVDPTVAYHSRLHLVEGEEVLDTWEVDLRGW